MTYAANIRPIFDGSCALAGCHAGAGAAAGLDLSPAAAPASLVGVVSNGYAPALRVAPGDPASSVLYDKVAGTGQFGGAMPPGGALSPAAVEAIRVWISEGARDD